MNIPYTPPSSPVKRPGMSLDQMGDAIVSGAPARKVLRGVSKGVGQPLLYSPDVTQWPCDPSNTPIPQLCWGGLMAPLHRANLHYLIAGVP